MSKKWFTFLGYVLFRFARNFTLNEFSLNSSVFFLKILQSISNRSKKGKVIFILSRTKKKLLINGINKFQCKIKIARVCCQHFNSPYTQTSHLRYKSLTLNYRLWYFWEPFCEPKEGQLGKWHVQIKFSFWALRIIKSGR